VKASCAVAALFCCASYQRPLENKVTFGPISIVPKRMEAAQIREWDKNKQTPLLCICFSHYPTRRCYRRLKMCWHRGALAPGQEDNKDTPRCCPPEEFSLLAEIPY